ncbi:phosphatase PAP2 family protein [Jatrophihabitans fulvus]
MTSERALPWRRVRIAAYLLYAAALLVLVIVDGVPTGRVLIAAIIVVGLLLTRIGLGWRAAGRVVLDWLPFSAVLMLYDRTRAAADAIGLPVHVGDVLDVEKTLFGGGSTIPTVWLQQHLYDPGTVHWYDVACTLIYTSHFLMTPVLAAVLWLRSRPLWLSYIVRVVALSAAGLVTYVLFPQAPPWYAYADGLTEPIARLSSRGWIPLGLGGVQQSLETAQKVSANPVAAMPSLHTAFAVLAAIFVISHLRSRWRWLALLYPFAMGFTLVYTGEHYVIDLVAGALYAVVVHLLVSRWEARRARRRAVAVPVEADGTPAGAPSEQLSPSARA